MIFTRSWLDEFVDVSVYSDDDLAGTLNAVGIEVASVKKINIPQGVVVGKVLSVEKHPSADKLNVCSVDTGLGISQIVCGAANVAQDQLVAVATLGCTLPNGLQIKPVNLRGVDSYGMLCSSTEIGLPKLSDGIMVLDKSIGVLKIGKLLAEYPKLCDTVFEIELTPNRGDCLSVRGIAREIAAFYGIKLRELELRKENDNDLGIGRILSLHSQKDSDTNMLFSLFENSAVDFGGVFLLDLRLAFTQIGSQGGFDRVISYATHATGTIVYAFGERAFGKNNENKIEVFVEKNEDGFDVTRGHSQLAILSVSQEEEFKPCSEDKMVILQACYTDPSLLQELSVKVTKKDDDRFYRAVRGSEPDLAFGIGYLSTLLQEHFSVSFYAGTIEDAKTIEKPAFKVDIGKINTIIGSNYDKNHIVTLLRRLSFDVTANAEFDSCIVKAPQFRHDITNVYDLAEEVVRMKGIDSIESKPLQLLEARRMGSSFEQYRFVKELRMLAIAGGFFEAVHFIFSDKSIYERFGLPTLSDKLDMVNPITAELDTLRTTLLVNLLGSVSKNIKNSASFVALFESGTVFDKKRNESQKMAFVHSGAGERDSLQNTGKPKEVDFYSFASKIADIIGGFELQKVESKGEFFHPYQSANILKNGQVVGFISKLHPKAAEFFELGSTYICELELKNMQPSSKKAIGFSKLQPITRDLTLQVPNSIKFGDIRTAVWGVGIMALKAFYAIDTYKDSSVKDALSLTVRLVLQPNEKTMDEHEISGIVDKILYALNSELGIGLKS